MCLPTSAGTDPTLMGGHRPQDWEPVVIRKRAPTQSQMKDEAAVNAVSQSRPQPDPEASPSLFACCARALHGLPPCGVCAASAPPLPLTRRNCCLRTQARRTGAAVDTVKKCKCGYVRARFDGGLAVSPLSRVGARPDVSSFARRRPQSPPAATRSPPRAAARAPPSSRPRRRTSTVRACSCLLSIQHWPRVILIRAFCSRPLHVRLSLLLVRRCWALLLWCLCATPPAVRAFDHAAPAAALFPSFGLPPSRRPRSRARIFGP